MGDDSQLVITKVTEDGTFDEIRRKVVQELKKDEALKSFIADAVEKSKTLSSLDVLRLQKRVLLEQLRRELEQQLLERTSEAAWKVMCSEDSEVSSFIDEKVHEALCSVYQEHRQQSTMTYAQPPYHQPSAAAPAAAQYQPVAGPPTHAQPQQQYYPPQMHAPHQRHGQYPAHGNPGYPGQYGAQPAAGHQYPYQPQPQHVAAPYQPYHQPPQQQQQPQSSYYSHGHPQYKPHA